MELDNKKQPADRLAVDRWLDNAMKQYGSIEPVAGLEQRVLRNLRAQSERSAPWQKWWVLAATAAVVLLAAAVLLEESAHKPQKIVAIPSEHTNITKTLPAPKKVTVSSNSPKQNVRRFPVAKGVVAQSWPAQFPTPQPLSSQEQLLAQYVRQQPRQAQLVARARAELLRQTLAELDARDHDKKKSSAFE